MLQPDRASLRRLTRRAIIDRALELGDAEGLDAVSLRRLATDLGVTPMALYRHVKDKQDLINAMYEAIVDDFDLRADVRPGMKWTNQLRRALMNIIALHDRLVAWPLAIAYSGSGSPAIWRMYEGALDILTRAGFTRREAVELNHMLAMLVAGSLLLFRQGALPESDELLLASKRFELDLLSLPRADFPNVVASARELADVQFSDPQLHLKAIVDFIVDGVEAMLNKRKGSRLRRHTRGSSAGANQP
jgi:TetR/AcrR family transcriptional regulator, tetracycline repressor protein